MRFEPIPEYDGPTIERMLRHGDPSELCLVALALALHSKDPEKVESVCLTLARHPDGNTRGNAVLALGHLARIHGRLTDSQRRATRSQSPWAATRS